MSLPHEPAPPPRELPGEPGQGEHGGTGSSPVRHRLRTAALFSGLAAAGLVAGIVTGRLSGTSTPTAAVLRPSQVMATGTPAPVVTTPSPSPSPSPTRTTPKPAPVTTKAVPPDYSPIPTDPTSGQGLDFGFLTAVTKNGDLVTISFDRAEYLTGDQATAANGGRAPDNDYLIKNSNALIRTFTVSSKAPLIGVNRLVGRSGGPVQRQPLDAATFVANATTALASGLGVPVWVRHTQGENGPVTSLAEQYIP